MDSYGYVNTKPNWQVNIDICQLLTFQLSVSELVN